MASIVYVTDRQMLEFHRLSGNRTMNFWRPGASRNIADFEKGDLVFFMVKGTERGRSKEKGLMGYGRFLSYSVSTVSHMWKKWKQLNGYADEQSFREAVIKLTKDKKLPARISGLQLENCTYFQSPVYLSEIGIRVSNSLESYFYPDKYEQDATQKILDMANRIGEDPWIAMMNREESDSRLFEEDSIRYAVSQCIARYGTLYEEKDARKAARMCARLMEEIHRQSGQAEEVKGSRQYVLSLQTNRVELFVPFVSSAKDENRRFQLFVGHVAVLKEEIQKKIPHVAVEVSLVFDDTLEEDKKNILQALGVSYLFSE